MYLKDKWNSPTASRKEGANKNNFLEGNIAINEDSLVSFNLYKIMKFFWYELSLYCLSILTCIF